MHYLVTGTTGFVGPHVVSELLAAGHRVTASASSIIKASTFSWFDQVTFIEYPINKPVIDQDLYHFFGCPDALIHLAWPDISKPASSVHTRRHIVDQYAFLVNMIEHGLPDLTVAGSCFEYGLASGSLEETILPVPTTPYGLAKDTLRKFLDVLTTDYSCTLRWVRLFYMYGEGQHANSLFSQLEAAVRRNDSVFNMSAGEQLRDYLPIREAARILCRLAMQQQVTGVINCCSGKPISIRRLVEEQLAVLQATMILNLGYYPYRDVEPMASWGNPDKMNRALSPVL